MGSKNQVAIIANRMASAIVAEQTRARIALGFDAAIIAANKVFHLGPGRAAAFADAYNEAMEWLADLYISDCKENRDKQMEYGKGKRDELILKIVGPENFVPFDSCYGFAYVDELQRLSIMKGAGNK